MSFNSIQSYSFTIFLYYTFRIQIRTLNIDNLKFVPKTNRYWDTILKPNLLEIMNCSISVPSVAKLLLSKLNKLKGEG